MRHNAMVIGVPLLLNAISSMNVHILQHVPFEGLGSIAAWLAARNADVSWTRFYADPTLPDPASVDCVIALGGPMSVNDEADLPWLAAEKRFIAAVIRAGKPVLGICLGAQLIASAFGAAVYPNAHKEIGWFEIAASGTGAGTFRFPERATVFHWHGETFDLPPGAVRLARSAMCENQAFQIGRKAIGLQFHLETTPESLAAIIDGCRDELVPGAAIQDEASLRAAAPEHFAGIHALMTQVLDYLLASGEW